MATDEEMLEVIRQRFAKAKKTKKVKKTTAPEAEKTEEATGE